MPEEIVVIDEQEIDRTLEEIRAALRAGRIQQAVRALTRLHPADRADAFAELPDTHQDALLPRLDIAATADLLEELEDEEAADIAEKLPADRLADVLDEMEPDEAADILGDLPPERAAEALAEMEEAEDVIPLLGHPDETAGGLMTTSYIALRPHTTAAQAIEFLRQIEPDEETPYYLYVIDRDRKLVGVVGLRDLVLAQHTDLIQDIMDPNVIFVTTDMDQEDVAHLMTHYDLAAVPVVDKDRVLVGVITYDDVLEVLQEEATEDIYRLANISDADLSIDTPVQTAVRRRLPWLYLNTLTALFAAWVISNFQSLYAQVAVLAVFQSVVTGMGGNAAGQSVAITVRALALGEIDSRSALRAVFRQGTIGLLQGISVGLVVGLGVYLWQGNLWLGIVLCLALIGNMFIGVIAATMVPLALKALRLDPALASTIFVTAVTDSIGFALFLGLASFFLPYLR